MSADFSIQLLDGNYNPVGQPQTLAALGIENLAFDHNNMAADVWTLTVGGKAFNAAALWPFGQSLVVLNPSGVRVFFGRVEPWTRDGNHDAQNHFGRLVNPWWYLQNKIYEQTYTISNYATQVAVGANPPPVVFTTYTTPRVVLNVLYDGNIGGPGFYAATTGQQIADAVQWAITQGAPIALGVCEPATLPFSDFQKGIFCADVIKLMFRKEPDFVMDWDYTTTPFPTVHFRKALTPMTIDLTDVSVRERVRIKERPDWQRSYVRLTYDQTNSINGGQYLNIYKEWYSALGQGYNTNGVQSGSALPADTESKFRGVDLFADLSGSNANSTSQTTSITTTLFAAENFDITSVDTWKKWKPALAAKNVKKVTILTPQTIPAADAYRPAPLIDTVDEVDELGVKIPYDPTCVYEVCEGEWSDWIPNVNGQRVAVTALAQIIDANGAVHYEQLYHEMTVVNKSTAGISKDFTDGQTNFTQYAEAIPVGLAKAMWTSWQNLALEGEFTNVEAIYGTKEKITRSNCLNFKTATPGVNGAPDWRAVKALVQRISGNIERGVVNIQFGAPLHITGHELIDAIRATRFRTNSVNIGYLFGGAIGGGNTNVKLGRKTHARHTQHGGTHNEVDVVSKAVQPVPGTDPIVKTDGSTGIQTWQPAATQAPTATVDPSACKGSDGIFHPVRFQEQKVCVKINGVLKQRTLIAWTSDIYQAPDDPA